MVDVLAVLIFSTLTCSVFTASLKCGINEVVDKCPRNCSYEYCPKDEYQDTTPCPTPTSCPPPSCKCSFNHRRAVNGTCIPAANCPPFECTRTNERYVSCPALCPSDSCSDASLHGVCPFFILIVIECNPKCQCKPDHWRKNGVCVPYAECDLPRSHVEEQQKYDKI